MKAKDHFAIIGGSLEAPIPEVDPEILRLAMRQWTTGVTIVTSFFQEMRHGMTVSSFTSVSLQPPLVMVSLEWGTRTHALVQQAGVFGISILSQEQQAVSDIFAGRHTEDRDRFAGLETFTLLTGVSFLKGSLASFDCRVISAFAAGNHTLYIGDVVAAHIGPADQPLVYYDRSYRRLES